MSLLLWDELLVFWQAGDFRTAHDWLNERWARVVQESTAADSDPFARFLQGLAFAALAFHFAAEQEHESAEIFIEDAIRVLSRYPHNYAGIDVAPMVDALSELDNAMPTVDAAVPIPVMVSSTWALRCSPGSVS